MRLSAISGLGDPRVFRPRRGLLGMLGQTSEQTSLRVSTDMMVGLAVGAVGMIFYLRKQQQAAR